MARLHNAVIRWNDNKREMNVLVVALETKTEYDVLIEGIENDDPKIMELDSRVWYYFDEYNPEDPISDYYKEQNGTDFVLVSLSEDYDSIKLEKEVA